jgi:hypothetical protein
MKKLLLMTAALVATTGAFARKVKFQVDMTGQTVSTNGVHIAGNFKNPNGGADENPSQYNWDPSQNAMTNGGSGTIYSIIMDLQGQLTYDFKFVNDNGWGGVESVPAIAQIGGGNDNRFAYINNGTDTLVMPAIKFSGAAPANQFAIRVKVDMSLASSVDTNGVHIAGSFQGWDPAKTRMVNHTGNGVYAGSIYTAFMYVDSGSYAYKFVNGNAWGKDESVPSECAVNNNRQVIADGNKILDAVCYGKCGVCKIVPKYTITFNVDVESICGVDSVDVAGGLLDGSWGDGNKMTRIGTSNKWTGSQANIDSGATVQFKYRYYKGGIRNWEQITSASGNREVKLTSDSVMPSNCFNTFGNCSPRPGSQKVTFKVDISKITPNGNQYVVIDYLGGKGAGAVRLSPMPGNPAVYQTTINDVCNGTVYYYFMNGDSSVDANAEAFADTADRACTKPNGVGGFQRELVRTSSSDLTLFYYFSSCKTSSTGMESNNNISENLKLYPNPTSTYSVIEFNDNSANHNVEIVDIAGRVIRTYENHKYNTLRIDRDELNAGIYFINVRNSNNQNGSIKLMID